MSDFHMFMPIMKVDEERRLVSGYASTPAKDSDGEIVTLEAVKAALPGYLEYGNIREMHKLNAVGVAAETNMDKKGLYLTAYISDDAAWKKCLPSKMADGSLLPPVYKGFSIGGRKLDKSGNKITELEMTEISVVDRPANPECRIDIAKSAKAVPPEAGGHLVKPKKAFGKTPEQKALAKMAKVVGELTKAGPPAARDGFSLPARLNVPKEVDGVISPNDSRPNENASRKASGDMVCDKHGKANCPICAVEKAQETTKPKGEYGDVKYADPGYQGDKTPRYPIDTAEHIRAAWNYIHKKKNAGKYSSAQVAHIKGAIVSEWKAKIDKAGPPSKDKAEKFAKQAFARALALDTEGVLTLRKAPAEQPAERVDEADPFVLVKSPKAAAAQLAKGMSTAGSLSYCFDSLRNVQRQLLMEGKDEGNDSKDAELAKTLGQIAKQLAGVIGDKAGHEGDEALTLTDTDDSYVNQVMNRRTQKMDGSMLSPTGDALTDAVAALMKRAAAPTKAQRMAMADDNVKKARKAMKNAREAVEDAHKMHKAAYIAKAAAKKKGDNDADDGPFDHAKAMEKLQKAYQEIDKARTFNKAATAQIEKLSRSGERGQETADAETGFYEVPRGVKDLTPDAMSGAAPGTARSAGVAPAYSGDGGVYPGKAAGGGDLAKFARGGHIPAEVAELLVKQASMEGELEALRRLPASALDGRRRPFAFDMTKTAGGFAGSGGSGHTPQDLQKALFEGVNVSAINGGDERAHVAESAKVIGNLLSSGQFGKSVLDPAFRGAAGSH